ncbi:hypothetical protein [Alkaliphilus hydrothermalis]|uniref:Uncharacterized protein n=1 Tax=Alkaliphilus hydrothermalis TaxID=1482730 RepID=A0ABS2NPP0_9FIRM|nr:hypothetical protein [Alkaliphilus hydrothermalis]MBM7614877.1 hypothetical protein [Alkaliphilus hydrothermalis]
MNNLQNTSKNNIDEMEGELRALTEMMIQVLSQQKHLGKLKEEEYQKLVINKLKFLA